MREFIDGFETGDLGLWDVVFGSSASATGPRPGTIGNWCLRCQGYVTKYLTARTEYYVAVKYSPSDLGQPFIKFLHSGTGLGCLRHEANGLLSIARGCSPTLTTGSTVLVTGTRSLQSNTGTYLLEMYYKPKTDGTGRFVLKIDGVTEIDFTGQTSNDALTIDQIIFGANNWVQFFDDVVIETSSWVGSTKIQALVPTGAGATTQYTPTTGSNYACVDEVPAGDTDYTYTNTSGNIDTYALGDLAGTIGSIKAVQVVARANYQGAATPVSLQGIVRSGGTNYTSATAALSTSFKPYGFLWENDPATSTAWTATGVNAMEAGAKSI